LLTECSALLETMTNAGLSMHGQITRLVHDRESYSSIHGGGGGGATGGIESGGPSSVLCYKDAAIGRAHHDPRFVACRDQVASLDLNCARDREEALACAYGSGCVIIFRFLRDMPQALRYRDSLYNSLAMCEADHRMYFARAQSMDPETGEVPELRRDWTWEDTELAKLRKGDFHQMEMVNAPDGCYGLEDKDSARQTAKIRGDDQCTVTEVLRHRGRFMHRTLVAAGYEALPNNGLSYLQVCDQMVDFLDFKNKLGPVEGEQYQKLCVKEFKDAHRYAGELHKTKVFSGEPANVTLDCWLPFGSQFQQNCEAKRRALLPLLEIQRALPCFMHGSGATRQVPGATGPTSNVPRLTSRFDAARPTRIVATRPRPPKPPRAAMGGGGKLLPAQGGGAPASNKATQPRVAGAKRDARGAAVRPGDAPNAPAGEDKPGSRQGLWRWLTSTLLVLAGRVYDTAAIAKHYSLDSSKTCFPVLLSNKQGSGALSLCPRVQEHGSMQSAPHHRPANFDLTYVIREFSREPTVGERSKIDQSRQPSNAQGKNAATGSGKRVGPI
jgi:hypothetical protein